MQQYDYYLFILPTPESLSLDAEHAVGLLKNLMWSHFAQTQPVGLQRAATEACLEPLYLHS